MNGLQTLLTQTGYYGPVILISLAVFLFAEAIFLSISRRRQRQHRINQRLTLQESAQDQREVLFELRLRRGLTAEGSYSLAFTSFNKLVTQSGTSLHINQILLLMLGAGLAGGVAAYILSHNPFLAAVVALFAGALLPYLFLLFVRSRRFRKIEMQLPEAIDIIVRGLKSGHPISVSLELVAREMPDPIGSEFGIVTDEMTYGLDLDAALSNLRSRTGQSDISFFVIATSVQSRTGGNLVEIMNSLSGLIRQRARMRRRIIALSSEGRFSAVALSVVPLGLYLLISTLSPGYYQDVSDKPLFAIAIYAGAVLWTTGVLIMYRMVNFKF